MLLTDFDRSPESLEVLGRIQEAPPLFSVKRPSRENREEKGRRYLVEGRVLLREVRGDYVDAVVRGTDRFHSVHLRGDLWGCSCYAKGRCSHLVAVQLVTVIR